VDLLAKLSRIGLNEFEAKIYLALLRDNPATGYQIAKEIESTRSEVNESLRDMHDRGIVLETLEGRATLYRPLPPLMLVAQNEAEHARMLAGLSGSLDEIYLENDDDRVWSLNGRTAVLNYAAQMIQFAETAIYLVLSDNDLRALRMEIEGACSRDLAVNVLLTGKSELPCGRVAYHPGQAEDNLDLAGTLLVAVEGAELLVSSDSYLDEMRATVTRNADLGKIARQMVSLQLYARGILSRLDRELLVRLEAETTQFYESIRD